MREAWRELIFADTDQAAQAGRADRALKHGATQGRSSSAPGR